MAAGAHLLAQNVAASRGRGGFRRQMTPYRTGQPAFGSMHPTETMRDLAVPELSNHETNDRNPASKRILTKMSDDGNSVEIVQITIESANNGGVSQSI